MKEISYGERGVIGLVYPNSGKNMEPEFYAMAPKGVCTLTTRIKLEDVSADSLKKMDEDVAEAAKLLYGGQADMIVLGCTSGSFIGGPGYDKEIIQTITDATGLKATTTSTAIVNGLRGLGVKKVALGTPYVDEVHQMAIKFLESQEFEVVNENNLNLIDDWDINNLTMEETKDFIRNVDNPEAEAVVIMCTSVKGVGILEEMEKELGKPVITAIQASMWECLKILDIHDEIVGFGRLFSV